MTEESQQAATVSPKSIGEAAERLAEILSENGATLGHAIDVSDQPGDGALVIVCTQRRVSLLLLGTIEALVQAGMIHQAGSVLFKVGGGPAH